MAKNDFQRNVAFSTNANNYDLLQDIKVKNHLMEAFGIDTDIAYFKLLSDRLLTIRFEIEFSNGANEVSINDSLYSVTVADFYESQSYVQGCQSIKIKNTGAVGFITFVIA